MNRAFLYSKKNKIKWRLCLDWPINVLENIENSDPQKLGGRFNFLQGYLHQCGGSRSQTDIFNQITLIIYSAQLHDLTYSFFKGSSVETSHYWPIHWGSLQLYSVHHSFLLWLNTQVYHWTFRTILARQYILWAPFAYAFYLNKTNQVTSPKFWLLYHNSIVRQNPTIHFLELKGNQ
jgi:hypothetical protein